MTDRPGPQLSHLEHRPVQPARHIQLVLNDFKSPANVGAVFRNADAFGVTCVHLCGGTQTPPNSKLRRLSRAADKFVPWQRHACAVTLVRQLKAEGIHIASLELTATSRALQNWQPAPGPWCVILGVEDEGVSDELLALSDVIVHIPMMGSVSSLNVGSACAVALYELACK